MKYTKYIWGLVAAMFFTACQSDDIAPTDPKNQQVGAMMPVRLRYTLDDQTLVTRSSLVSGTEKPITSIKMLCFNQADAFLGCFDATLRPETDFTGILDGEVNSNTTKVHFIANHPGLIVSLSSNYLRDMRDLIQDKVLTLNYDENNDGAGGKCMSYWTYHAEPTPQQMADFLSPPQGSEDKYIHFVRDRVKIEATEITSAVMTESKVSSVKWTVSDGLTKGYIIPWHTFDNNTDFIGTDINAAFFNATVGTTPYGNIKITPYEKNNRQRYTNSSESSLENFAPGSALYVFEDYNNGTYNGSVTESQNKGMIRLIFEVTYTNGHKRYHVIKLADDKDAPYQLKRNHNYRVTIKSLAETQAALDNFQDALTTDQFSNDQFASVADIVPSVSGAANTLTVVGKTSKILTPANTTGDGPTDRQYTVYFTLKDGNGNGISAPNYNLIYDGMDASFGTVVSSAYNSSTGEGRVTIQLAQAIPGSGQAPNTGRLRIYDSVSRLYRYVLFYAVEEFTYPTSGTPTMTRATGNDNSFNSTYNLTFTIPANYPEGLYPVTVVIGTRTLTPTGISRTASDDFDAATLTGSFAVDVESTGATGWNYAGGSDVWNSNANNWNYVYKFKILEKPVNKNSDTGEYSTQNATYTITLRDDREKINAATTDDVGLFFEVENFGHTSQYQVHGRNTAYTSTKSSN